MNDFGATIDAVFYNKQSSDCGNVKHSGDQRDGTSTGFDEVISIDLKNIKMDVSYMAVLINSFKGVGFKNVETATVSIMQFDERILEISLGSVTA